MSYDISFRVKAEGIDRYIEVGECDANITWNVGEMIRKSTGLEWKNEESNGLVKDVIPHIIKGLAELEAHPGKYMKYEAPNGWGTIGGCKNFFRQILTDWANFQEDYMTRELVDVVVFWIG